MKKLFTLLTLVMLGITLFSQTNKNYIAVGYSSICCGTASSQPVIDFVKKFEKKLRLKPFEMWIEDGLGKEGEYTLYIGTDNLNADQLKSFWNGLKMTASNQKKQRSKNGDGYVNVDDKLTPNATLKSIKAKPRTRISSLKSMITEK